MSSFTMQFGDQFLGNCKGELSTAFTNQSRKEREPMHFLGIAWKAKIKKKVCFSSVMDISHPGDSTEFKSGMHLSCKHFSRTSCRSDIISVTELTTVNRTLSQL